MSEKEIKDLFDAIDNRLILYQATNQIPNIDFDRLVKLSVAYEELQQENQQLKEQLKQRDEVIDELKNYIANSQLTISINGTRIYGGKNANRELQEILKKYKGDNNE